MGYKVYGHIKRSDNNQPLQGLLVRSYDVDWITSDDYLGQSVTDTNGYFEIPFSEDDFDAGWYDPEGGPDIVLKIYFDSRLVHETAERSGAGEHTSFDIRLNPLDLLGEFTVGGTIRDGRSLRPLCNLKVEGFDDDWIFDDYLGHTHTDHNGGYLIPFTHDSFDGLFEGRPDIYVKIVNNDGRVLAKSSTRDESPNHSTINVMIPAQEISWDLSECVYGWRAAYRQEGTHIIVKIHLDPDDDVTDAEVAALKNTWKTGIENKWSNHFVSRCVTPGCTRKGDLTFEVQWVESGAHHNVRIRRGPQRSNMGCWDTGDTGDVASHEFGHMIGLVDEYSDPVCPARSPVNTGTVMDDNTEVLERHVEHFCRLLNEDAAPRTIPGELIHDEFYEPIRKHFDMDKNEKYKMCLMPDLKARQQLKTSIQNLIKTKTSLGKGDKIIHTISGGIEGKRLLQILEISADGQVNYSSQDQLLNKNETYTSKMEAKSLQNLFHNIISTKLLDLKEAGGPFLPDSIIGSITLEIGGEKTTYYYLADPEQRRDQKIIMKQAVSVLDNNFRRLTARTIKRDDSLQKRINDVLKRKKDK